MFSNKKIRNTIKKRLLSELTDENLPLHRRIEVESYLYYIECHDREEKHKYNQKLIELALNVLIADKKRGHVEGG